MRVYITFLSSASYLPGVACLAASLKRTGTKVPLVVALSHRVAVDLREKVAALAGVSGVLVFPPGDLVPSGTSNHGHYWDYTFDKLRLFGLREFSKLVYLDSDMVVLQNLDGLFEAPHMAAVVAGKLLHPEWGRLNSGLMVIEPQEGLPERIAQMVAIAMRERVVEAGQPALGDQDLINSYYPDWPLAGPHLDESYNVFFEDVDAYLATGRYTLPGYPDRSSAAGQPLCVVHFIGPIKPWTRRGRLRLVLARLRGRLGPGQREVLRTYSRLLRAGTWS